jgi:hypothetical protein
MRVWLLSMIVLAGSASCALADEQTQVTAQSGDWAAMTHSPSETDPPDLCIAFNPISKVGLRSDGTTTSIRIINDSWSLPAEVQGTIIIAVGSDTQTLAITSNTSASAEADIDPSAVQPLLDAMAKETEMKITIGKAKPLIVSLSGSTVVLNAFRTCANIGGSAPGGGSNPFQ